ncbi:MAG: 3-deoxy-8-phosphooctulonate synthase [Ignavibacteriales bacterium]|nr:3-deoxy-8-phosphooctulonate synthase [Ignavibacteriales bacterium]
MAYLANLTIGGGNKVVLIAGPCVVENREITFKIAKHLDKLTRKYKLPFIFKASYKKANRTSGKSFSTIGFEKALSILSDVKNEFEIPLLTDVHTEEEIEAISGVADVIQIPAFLCRQTELLQAAGRSGKTVNIKKGQFMAPGDMKHSAEKVLMTGNKKILLTERGATFGYNNLVVDMRSLVIMRSLGYPVILDATHSVQLPGAGKNQTAGQPEFIFPIARAGVAVGIDGLFIETHPDPKRALSDAGSQLKLNCVEDLIKQIMPIDRIVKDKIENK